MVLQKHGNTNGTTDIDDYVNNSDAPELSSARIQLELKAFQLSLARLVLFLAQLGFWKKGRNELFVPF